MGSVKDHMLDEIDARSAFANVLIVWYSLEENDAFEEADNIMSNLEDEGLEVNARVL